MSTCVGCGQPCRYTGLVTSEGCGNSACRFYEAPEYVDEMQAALDSNPRVRFMGWAMGNDKFKPEFGNKMFVGFVEAEPQVLGGALMRDAFWHQEYPRGPSGWKFGHGGTSYTNVLPIIYRVTPQDPPSRTVRGLVLASADELVRLYVPLKAGHVVLTPLIAVLQVDAGNINFQF